MRLTQETLFLFICIITIAWARRQYDTERNRRGPVGAQSAYNSYGSQPSDLQAAATGHHHGRVQIKVYRGPDTHGGHHHEHFAPYGFWVKQPADQDHHH